MKIKKMIFIILFLIGLQLTRISTKFLVFSIVLQNLMSDVIFNIVFMLIMSVIIIIFIKRKKINIYIFPKKFNKVYIILTVMLVLFIVITPIITKNDSLYNILFLIYGAIVTVIFEELIFRGIIFKAISNMENDLIAYIVSTILFGIWHLGYIDTILWRTTMFNPDASILNIMFWKVITGIIYGTILGFFRYKKKNVYSSMLIHSLLNTFGS